MRYGPQVDRTPEGPLSGRAWKNEKKKGLATLKGWTGLFVFSQIGSEKGYTHPIIAATNATMNAGPCWSR